MEVSHEEFEREKENFSKKKLAKMVSGLMEELEVMKKMYQELKDTKAAEATVEEDKVDATVNPEEQTRPTFMYAEEDFGGAGYITSVLKDHPEISLNSSYVFSDPAEKSSMLQYTTFALQKTAARASLTSLHGLSMMRMLSRSLLQHT